MQNWCYGFNFVVEVTGGKVVFSESLRDRLRCHVLLNHLPDDAMKEASDELTELFTWHVQKQSAPSLPPVVNWIEPAGMRMEIPPPLELPEE